MDLISTIFAAAAALAASMQPTAGQHPLSGSDAHSKCVTELVAPKSVDQLRKELRRGLSELSNPYEAPRGGDSAAPSNDAYLGLFPDRFSDIKPVIIDKDTAYRGYSYKKHNGRIVEETVNDKLNDCPDMKKQKFHFDPNSVESL